MAQEKYKIFIDGQAGTTGLQVAERLKNHPDVAILEIAPEDRKNASVKEGLMRQSDITILCLPDAAVAEAVALADSAGARVIDASSVNRCHPDWVYGLPELESGQREKIRGASRVANPGCYATGAVLLTKPLVSANLLKSDAVVHIQGVSGYSGGGTGMIDSYEKGESDSGFGLYGLGFNHKHIPEIHKWSGLQERPIFFPGVVKSRQGMHVLITLDDSMLSSSGSNIKDVFSRYYEGDQFVRVTDLDSSDKFCYLEGLNNSNYCDIHIFRSEEFSQTLLVAKLDNLGKGAGGAAVQNMNVMLGLPETTAVDLS